MTMYTSLFLVVFGLVVALHTPGGSAYTISWSYVYGGSPNTYPGASGSPSYVYYYPNSGSGSPSGGIPSGGIPSGGSPSGGSPSSGSPSSGSPSGGSPSSGSGAQSNMDASKDQDEIVNKHNALRRGVTPTATNMLKMQWNDEAAANAQRWANKCTMSHSKESQRTISSGVCGENLYMSSEHDSWSDAIQDWYNESQNWKYGVGSTNGAVVGHFTQVVWYNSYKIGCAIAYCPNSDTSYYYVCQYCPAGNYQQAYPYKAGPACGACPNDCDNGLCTNPCDYSDEYNNCPSLKQSYGCSNPTVSADCKGSCQCNGKIF